jgi:hypothetical protein
MFRLGRKLIVRISQEKIKKFKELRIQKDIFRKKNKSFKNIEKSCKKRKRNF